MRGGSHKLFPIKDHKILFTSLNFLKLSREVFELSSRSIGTLSLDSNECNNEIQKKLFRQEDFEEAHWPSGSSLTLYVSL